MKIEKYRVIRYSFTLLLFLFINCKVDKSYDNNIQIEFEEIEILVDQPHKPVKIFHVDSNGMFLELFSSKKNNGVSILSIKLNENELDSISGYIENLKSFKFKNKPNSSCADGLMYDMTISIEGKPYDFNNVICNEIQYPDKLIKLLLDLSKSKSKDSLFTKYEDYIETQAQVDSILNLTNTNR
ncbi:hypothetical protein [Zunongwangia sp.]|uniref:hypothetical protein n=1 Tax=Zunongwangia sp. TaxID=1965325 RepID=UPI003AA82040